METKIKKIHSLEELPKGNINAEDLERTRNRNYFFIEESEKKYVFLSCHKDRLETELIRKWDAKKEDVNFLKDGKILLTKEAIIYYPGQKQHLKYLKIIQEAQKNVA